MSKSNTARDFLSIKESEAKLNPATLDLFDHVEGNLKNCLLKASGQNVTKIREGKRTNKKLRE